MPTRWGRRSRALAGGGAGLGTNLRFRQSLSRARVDADAKYRRRDLLYLATSRRRSIISSVIGALPQFFGVVPKFETLVSYTDTCQAQCKPHTALLERIARVPTTTADTIIGRCVLLSDPLMTTQISEHGVIKILILGAGGMLGSACYKLFSENDNFLTYGTVRTSENVFAEPPKRGKSDSMCQCTGIVSSRTMYLTTAAQTL